MWEPVWGKEYVDEGHNLRSKILEEGQIRCGLK